jgi:hypothetical protein
MSDESNGVYWTVHHRDELVGTIVPRPPLDAFPPPWQWGTFTPTAGFEAVRGLLADRLSAVPDAECDTDERRQRRSRFQQEPIQLERHPDGLRFAAFSLHIDEARAWWSELS